MNTTNETSTAMDSGKNSAKRRLMFVLLGLAVALCGGGYWAYWQMVGSRYVTTDNAYTAAEVAQVTSETGGLVEEVRVVDTQKVNKGDVLVVLDAVDAKLAMAQAQAESARAKAQLAIAVSDAERASIDLKRREALAGSGSVSGDELTRAKNGARIALAALEAAKATVEQARVNCDRAEIDLERTVIRSPVDGVVVHRQVQLGQRVQPSAPLLSVVPVQDMYVNANFKEVQLEAVRPGQPVEMVSDLYGERVVFHGEVEGFSGGTGSAFALIPAQNATGNWIKVVQRLPVRVRLDPAELIAHPLRVGLSMAATIDLRGKH